MALTHLLTTVGFVKELVNSSNTLIVSLSATSHTLSNWTLSIPLVDTETSSNVFTVCFKSLVVLWGAWKYISGKNSSSNSYKQWEMLN